MFNGAFDNVGGKCIIRNLEGTGSIKIRQREREREKVNNKTDEENLIGRARALLRVSQITGWINANMMPKKRENGTRGPSTI